MIIIFAVCIGILLGVRNARKRGGTRADILQYGFVYAIAFGLVALVITVLLDRLLL